MFQFLYGAIKRNGLGRSILVSNEFQFLYGAIKSKNIFQLFLNFFCFNSYMVRLKVYVNQPPFPN